MKTISLNVPRIDANLVRWLYIRQYKVKELDLSNTASISACMDIAGNIWSILDARSTVTIRVNSREDEKGRFEHCLILQRCLDSLPTIERLQMIFSMYDKRYADMLVVFDRATTRLAQTVTEDVANTVAFLHDTRLAPFTGYIYLPVRFCQRCGDFVSVCIL